MPKDKTVSHIRVKEAMTREFIEKGYEGASIRSIGARAGMTSAGLYRHYPDKEAMFSEVVEPLIREIKTWTRAHKERAYQRIGEPSEQKDLFRESFIDMIYEVILPRKEEFRLLLTASKGTRYENFVHDYVLDNQKEIMGALKVLKSRGFPVKELDEDQLHILLSAYLTACFEPIIHNYPDEKIMEYMKMIQEFFIPGWKNIMGLK